MAIWINMEIPASFNASGEESIVPCVAKSMIHPGLLAFFAGEIGWIKLDHIFRRKPLLINLCVLCRVATT